VDVCGGGGGDRGGWTENMRDKLVARRLDVPVCARVGASTVTGTDTTSDGSHRNRHDDGSGASTVTGTSNDSDTTHVSLGEN
jgi:hypothetical protein